LFTKDRLDAGDVPPQILDPLVVVQLTRGVLEAEVEELLLRFLQTTLDLVVRQVPDIGQLQFRHH
jgi:hypothetical protein